VALLKPSPHNFHFSCLSFLVLAPATITAASSLLPGFKETAFLYAISSAGLTHAMAKACSAGRMERCTCDEAPDLENREAWQWGGCGDNLKYSNKFVKEFLGRKPNKDLRARVDFHNNLVGMKVSRRGARPAPVDGCEVVVAMGFRVLWGLWGDVLDAECMEPSCSRRYEV